MHRYLNNIRKDGVSFSVFIVGFIILLAIILYWIGLNIWYARDLPRREYQFEIFPLLNIDISEEFKQSIPGIEIGQYHGGLILAFRVLGGFPESDAHIYYGIIAEAVVNYAVQRGYMEEDYIPWYAGNPHQIPSLPNEWRENSEYDLDFLTISRFAFFLESQDAGILIDQKRGHMPVGISAMLYPIIIGVGAVGAIVGMSAFIIYLRLRKIRRNDIL